MSESSDFDDVAREFQGVARPSEDLVQAVERGTKKLERGRRFAVVITILLVVSAFVALWRHPDSSMFSAAVMIGVPVALNLFVSYSERYAWRARNETTRGFLELEIERRRDWLRRMRFLRRIVIVLAVAHAVHDFWRGAPAISEGIRYAILAGLYWQAGRRRARFEREENDLVKKLADLEATP